MRNLLSIKIAFMAMLWVGAVSKAPCFLLLGQSNMVGNVNATALKTTMKILQSSGNSTQIAKKLVNHLKLYTSVPKTTPTSVLTFEASKVMDLWTEGYLQSLFELPLSAVLCSFTMLKGGVDYRFPGTNGSVQAINAQLSPAARCGVDFGPELMLGRVLRNYSASGPVRLIKVASGGTSISAHWSKQNGTLWPQVVKHIWEAIDPTQEQWKGIIWFQGEHESVRTLQIAQDYLGHLENLVSNLRGEVHAVDPTNFANSSDIPVIVVGLGCQRERYSKYGKIVMDAQRNFTAMTNNTFLVSTRDLSCNLHYDHASMLVIGHRIGLTVLEKIK